MALVESGNTPAILESRGENASLGYGPIGVNLTKIRLSI